MKLEIWPSATGPVQAGTRQTRPWSGATCARALSVALLLLVNAMTSVPADAATGTAGCGQPAQTGDTTQTLPFGGLSRTFLVHVPIGYNSNLPQPLIVHLHGLVGDAVGEEAITGMSSVADAQGFIVVYPNGTTGADGITSGWNAAFPGNNPPTRLTSQFTNWLAVDDQGFLSAMVAHLGQEYCVDSSRIGMTGYSDGGFMAFHMACVGAPWLASIAPVGVTQPWVLSASDCSFGHPVSLLDFHGENDWWDSYWGWLIHPTVPQTMASYAASQGCGGVPQSASIASDVVETSYAPCQHPNIAVQLYSITDGGHEWPGGLDLSVLGLGYTTKTINASQLIGTFVSAHPLQAGS